jgi:hypothetical protein
LALLEAHPILHVSRIKVKNYISSIFIPCEQYIPVTVTRNDKNRLLQTFINSSNFFPDVLFQLLKCARFVRVHFRLSRVPRESRSREVRRPGRPGDITQTWNDATRKHRSHTVQRFTYCVCCDTVLLNPRVHHQHRQHRHLMYPAWLNIVLRLRSLDSYLLRRNKAQQFQTPRQTVTT